MWPFRARGSAHYPPAGGWPASSSSASTSSSVLSLPSVRENARTTLSAADWSARVSKLPRLDLLERAVFISRDYLCLDPAVVRVGVHDHRLERLTLSTSKPRWRRRPAELERCTLLSRPCTESCSLNGARAEVKTGYRDGQGAHRSRGLFGKLALVLNGFLIRRCDIDRKRVVEIEGRDDEDRG